MGRFSGREPSSSNDDDDDTDDDEDKDKDNDDVDEGDDNTCFLFRDLHMIMVMLGPEAPIPLLRKYEPLASLRGSVTAPKTQLSWVWPFWVRLSGDPGPVCLQSGSVFPRSNEEFSGS